MDADRQHSSRPIKTLAVVITVVGIALFCVVVSVAGFADEFEEVEHPQVLTETEVPFDSYSLPQHPAEEDWYAVAVQLLEDSGWNLDPNLTMIWGLLSCQSYPAWSRLRMEFADAYFDGVVPHLKMASVSFAQSATPPRS